MQELKFTPEDILFFKDGRPMEASRPGYGSNFPSPHIVNSALHAAAHRSAAAGGLPMGHVHRARRQGLPQDKQRTRLFGSLVTAGPFFISEDNDWYFPMPADLYAKTTCPGINPGPPLPRTVSSLQSVKPGLWPVKSTIPPGKDKPPQWCSQDTFQAYLNEEETKTGFAFDQDFYDSEYKVGIGLDDTTGAVEEGLIYSASQMRLKPGVQLGCYASLKNSHKPEEADLLEALFPASGKVRMGGECRTCQVTRSETDSLKLPQGPKVCGHRVKWVLLSPAIFPATQTSANGNGTPHPGGWLPNWIDAATLEVKLLYGGPGIAKARRLKVPPGNPVKATLKAARIPPPEVISGWAIDGEDPERSGAKSTLLAVPAGSIYYFEADSAEDAFKLAELLNWHGGGAPDTIRNRRSALMGEKGFGLGVCTSWEPLQ